VAFEQASELVLSGIGSVLQQTLRAMEAFMLNAPVGILFTRDRCVTQYNREFARMFGFEGDSGVAIPARVLYRSDAEYDAVGSVAAPLLPHGRPFMTEMFMRRQDGSDLWVNLIGYVRNVKNTREGTICDGQHDADDERAGCHTPSARDLRLQECSDHRHFGQRRRGPATGRSGGGRE